jgi:hypothetical protein
MEARRFETALAETTGAETVNVLSHGVRAVGCPNDDAPALRAIFTAARPGQVILFPAGHTYALARRWRRWIIAPRTRRG